MVEVQPPGQVQSLTTKVPTKRPGSMAALPVASGNGYSARPRVRKRLRAQKSLAHAAELVKQGVAPHLAYVEVATAIHPSAVRPTLKLPRLVSFLAKAR